jgi:hypothetical protein
VDYLEQLLRGVEAAGESVNTDLLEIIELITVTMDGLKGEEKR